MRRASFMAVSVIILLSVAATAQESRSEFSVQGTVFFTKGASSGATDYSATESGGVLGTYRFHLNHWLSAEGAYGFSQNTQKYLLLGQGYGVQAGIHQFTGSLVVNLPSRPNSRFNPYLLAGGGALWFSPSGNQLSGAQSQDKAAFVYGAGVNYGIHKGVAIRAEYRGLVYSTPDFGFGALSTNSITHTAEPSVGISFRF